MRTTTRILLPLLYFVTIEAQHDALLSKSSKIIRFGRATRTIRTRTISPTSASSSWASTSSISHDSSTSGTFSVLSPRGGAYSNKVAQKISQQQHLVGRLQLLFVSFLYGTLNVGLQCVYNTKDPPSVPALSFVRGWLAAACFLPIAWRSSRIPPNKNEDCNTNSNSTQQYHQVGLWTAALEMALWTSATFALWNLGLIKSSSSARVAFLIQTSVIITPLLSLWTGHTVHKPVWFGCLVALGGLVILAGGGSVVATTTNDILASRSSLTGDAMVLGSAFCWSIYLVRMNIHASRYPTLPLQTLICTLKAVLYTVWFAMSALSTATKKNHSTNETMTRDFWSSAVASWVGWRNIGVWMIIFYTALGPGAIASLVQQQAQKSVSPAETNVILSLESCFTGILAFFILGETMTTRELLGGSLILCAAMLASGSLDRFFSWNGWKG